MKIRNGFISNSSSSSFIIAVKEQSGFHRQQILADRVKRLVDERKLTCIPEPQGEYYEELGLGGAFIGASNQWCRSVDSLLDHLHLETEADLGKSRYKDDRLARMAYRLAKEGYSVALGEMHGAGDFETAYEDYIYHNAEDFELNEPDVVISFVGDKV